MGDAISDLREVPVGALVVTRTDERGIIQAYNTVFQQFTGFSPEDLHHAPHKIIRNSDMPKGVFWLWWDLLKKGIPIGCYVKNHTKDGGYYWIFATVSPLVGGYISMRVKPEPAGLKSMDALYGRLKERETREKLCPEEGAAALLEMIRELGYENYPAFMADHLARTQLSRNLEMGRPDNPSIRPLQKVSKTWKQVIGACQDISRDYSAFGSVSTNLQVQASHLKGTGVALGAVASNFALIAGQINQELAKFAEEVADVSDRIEDTQFLVCLQDVMEETQYVLGQEEGFGVGELAIIRNQNTVYRKRAENALDDVLKRLGAFIGNTQRIKRNISGLSVTRVMCAIENSQLGPTQQSSVQTIIQELRRFQNSTETNIIEIRSCLDKIYRDIDVVRRKNRGSGYELESPRSAA